MLPVLLPSSWCKTTEPIAFSCFMAIAELNVNMCFVSMESTRTHSFHAPQ